MTTAAGCVRHFADRREKTSHPDVSNPPPPGCHPVRSRHPGSFRSSRRPDDRSSLHPRPRAPLVHPCRPRRRRVEPLRRRPVRGLRRGDTRKPRRLRPLPRTGRRHDGLPCMDDARVLRGRHGRPRGQRPPPSPPPPSQGPTSPPPSRPTSPSGWIAEEAARAGYGRLVAILAHRTRDIAAAEDAPDVLTGEAIWLARLLVSLMPYEPEPKSLLALML